MPRNSQRVNHQLSDEDDEGPSMTRASQRKSKSSVDNNKKKRKDEKDNKNEDDEASKEDISADIKKHKVDDVVRYCLTCNQNQKAVQRTDIVRNCLGKEYSQFFNEVFAGAKFKLEFVFGIQVLESDQKRGSYYLVNALPHTEFLGAANKTQSVSSDALLYAILSNIFMRNPEQKMIDEKCFLGFLTKLGITLTTEHGLLPDKHPIFGDVRKLVHKTFVEQGWLEIGRQAQQQPQPQRKQKREGGEQQEASAGGGEIFAWGWRSYLVLRRGDMLNFVAEIMFNDGNRAATWMDHLEVARQEDDGGDGGC